MAGYETDFDGFVTALGLATAAAVVMPYAWPIVGLMGLMVADPFAQDQAADQWLNPHSVNISPASASPLFAGGGQQEWRPPMAAPAASDIAALRGELQRLTKEIGEAGDWEGRAYQSFKDKVDVLDGHLATLDENRTGCGNTLRCTAQGYHVLMSVCIIVGAFLEALAVFVLACRMSVAGALQGEAAAMRAVVGLHNSVSTVFKNHWKLIMKATGILGIAGIAYNQFAKDLPGLQAVSASKPNLMEASAIYDAASLDMVDSPESKFDTGQFEQPSLMPGW
ncbi:hypothetical protein EDD27_10284 [Nonomuraea polychroma]|uniref:Type VII secretion system (Wss) protein ESAT-6 n=1 Tax=Nonomuraea polychroma TaxID=46176 RepID=A0A438MNF9_9ACTN|nr:hypothetical protein [Nonomuraea polychroma]RVX47354.1 hypothetical protein EDD27_10284 [Nonomuraea polychroma]